MEVKMDLIIFFITLITAVVLIAVVCKTATLALNLADAKNCRRSVVFPRGTWSDAMKRIWRCIRPLAGAYATLGASA